VSEEQLGGFGVANHATRDLRRVLRIFRVGGNFDLRASGQLIAGVILPPLGLLIILLAWYGAAHTGYVQQQIPYLVSGSFIGLGLMFVGGMLFWAHWLYRIYDQADLHHQEQLRQQRELHDALLEALSQGRAPARGRAVAASAAKGASAVLPVESYVATAAGSNFHVASCPVVSRNRNGLRKVSAREAASMQPCRICDPPSAAATS
jgi:hypothetical protein